jgi:hypothetical protein
MINLSKLSHLLLTVWLFFINPAVSQAVDLTFTPVVAVNQPLTVAVAGTSEGANNEIHTTSS